MGHPTTICLFLILFVCYAMQSSACQVVDTSVIHKVVTVPSAKPNRIAAWQSMLSNPGPPVIKSINALPVKTLPQNFYMAQIGFFCTKELQVEKLTKIPFRFRLGSVQYTDGMEGKNNGRRQ
ncbi:MAG: hypothetical protein LH478_03070 [Chitinophagaceae bacterium]|nr:hypothetical protein [Chitinophagaceae bacterium]